MSRRQAMMNMMNDESLGLPQVQSLCQMAEVVRTAVDEVRIVFPAWDESAWDDGDLEFIVSRKVDPELFRRLCRDESRTAALEDFFDRLFRLALVH
jgi:hypothetical protein